MVKTGPFSDSLRVRLSTKLPLTGESGAHSVLGADNLTCLLGRSCEKSGGNQWFPIPMRGNEVDTLSLIGRHDRVPNPHEG